MKRLLFATTILIMALSGFAQGTIDFQNGPVSPILFPSLLPPMSAPRVPSGNLPYGGPLVVGLLWGTSANSVNNLGATALIGPNPGVFNGNNSSFGLGADIVGTNPGDTDWFEVVAWDSAYGTTLAGEQLCMFDGGWWGSANSPGYGFPGSPLPFTLGPTQGPGAVVFGSLPGTGVFHLFTINTLPEPSTIGLGCLGAAALLMFHRKTRNNALPGRANQASTPLN